MLTADLVRVSIRQGKISVRGLSAKAHPAVVRVAEAYITVLRGSIGSKKAVIDQELGMVEVGSSLQKVATGLRKLVYDRCKFDMDSQLKPTEIRPMIFQSATALRRAPGSQWCRDDVLKLAGEAFSVSPAEIECALYADLKQEQRLVQFDAIPPLELVSEYLFAQHQAILLKATEVKIEAQFESVGAARTFFRQLKFQRLLYTVRSHEKNTYELVISGAHALFRSSTKYGLQLAIMLRRLVATGGFRLEASIIWGRHAIPLVEEIETKNIPTVAAINTKPSDEIKALVKAFAKLGSEWKASRARTLIQLPGHDVCIPDIVFKRSSDKAQVYLEVMGFWSREAVWRRIDMVKAGLDKPVIFAVSERLRVSESLLGEGDHSTLYVYKGVINARRLLQIVENVSLA
jgi:predicted nuclease of restriction endonuclease-like RecB superfamily